MTQVTKVVISGARGPLGAASGPLGAGSVTADTISNDSGEQSDILAKIGGIPSAFSHGTSYSASTVGKKLQQVISLDDAPYSAAGDGATDDTAKFTALASALASAGGGIVHLGKNKNYLIDEWDLSSCSNVTIITNGSTFTERTGASDTSVFITLGAGCSIDHFEYVLPTGKTRRYVIDLQGAFSSLGSYNITSVDQQNNRGSNDDAAITLSGSFNMLGSGTVTKFDNAYRFAGTDSIADEIKKAVSYVRAFWWDTTTRGEFGDCIARTTSANSVGTAGHNSFLVTDATGGHARILDGQDAGEHILRFGGQATGSTDFTIDQVLGLNPGAGSAATGAVGIKVRADAGIRNTRIHIKYASLGDCGIDGSYGSNEEAVLVERCDGFTIDYLHVYKSSQTNSCSRGVLTNSSTQVRINDGYVADCQDQAVYLENTDDGGTTKRNLTDVYMNLTVVSPTSHAVYMVYSGATFRNINININGRIIGGDGFHIANDGTGTLADVCHFTGILKTVSGSAVAGTATTSANANLYFEYVLDGVKTRYQTGTSTSGVAFDVRSLIGGALTRNMVIRSDGDLENTNNSYGALSDERIKADIEDAGSQWEDIKALRLRSFTHRITGDRQLGLIAQETVKVSPGLLSLCDDEETLERLHSAYPDATEQALADLASEGPLAAIKYSIINLKMLGVVQELQARVEALEGRA